MKNSNNVSRHHGQDRYQKPFEECRNDIDLEDDGDDLINYDGKSDEDFKN